MRDTLVLGRIYTLDEARPFVDAALIRDGAFSMLGAARDCIRAAAAGADVLEIAAGGSATAGLADAHGHVLSYGRSLEEVNCLGAGSEQECAERAASAAASLPAGAWVRGRGWDQTRWPGQRFPTARVLSSGAPGRPAALSRVDGHCLWVNEEALALAGIGAGTPDPPGGRIERLPDGRPAGVLVDRAMDPVVAILGEPGPDEQERAVRAALPGLVRAGLTSVHDAGASPELLAIYRRLAERDELPLRLYAMIDGQMPPVRLEHELAAWRGAGDVGRLSVRAVKIFADGALGSRGAALFDPYADDPGNTGLLLATPEELRRRIALAAAAGFQPAVHAIGDRANAEVLAAFAALGTRVDLAALCPRVEHAQVVRRQDLPLFRRASAVASVQPVHAVGDAPWAADRLGRGSARLAGAYAWRTLLDNGVPLAFGSDFPVESFDPMKGIHAAETRLPAGESDPFLAAERLTRVEALRAYTRGAALAARASRRRGEVAVGQAGDLTLYDRDILAVGAEELCAVRVTHAVVGGRVEAAAGDR